MDLHSLVISNIRPILGTLLVIGITIYWFVLKGKPSESEAKSSEEAPKKSKTTPKPQKQEEPADIDHASLKKLKKMTRQSHHNKRSKPIHKFFDHNICEISGKKIDMDLSQDHVVLFVATEDRRHYIVNAKKILGKHHHFKAITFKTEHVPSKCAVSEHGKYVALSFEKHLEVYKVGRHDVELLFETKDLGHTSIIGLYISEEYEIIVSVGGSTDPDIHILDLENKEIHVEKTKITKPYAAIFDKNQTRLVMKSRMGSFRIYKIKHDNFGHFKGFKQEYLVTGYKGHMLDVGFSRNGEKVAVVSEGGHFTIYTMHHIPSFADATLLVAKKIEFEEEYDVVEWCFEEEDPNSEGVFAMSSYKRMDFVRVFKKGYKKDYEIIDTVEDPHVGNVLLQMIFRKKKEGNVTFFTRCCSRVYSWKMKLHDHDDDEMEEDER